MKLIVLITLHGFVAVPWALCQDKPEQLHQMSGQVSISASTIQRDISQATYTPVIHLKGNVEIIKISAPYVSWSLRGAGVVPAAGGIRGNETPLRLERMGSAGQSRVDGVARSSGC